MGRRTFLEDRLRPLPHNEARWGEMARGLKPFDLADENLLFRIAFRRRANWHQGIGPKYRHELVNSLKKDLHVFAVGLGELWSGSRLC